MGLDMYLYVEENQYGGDSDAAYKALDIAGLATGIKHTCVRAQVAYWRKANAIHAFFCSLDDWRDECQPIEVRREDLIRLLLICKEVKNTPSRADELLPSQCGFFFGSTEYDECYFEEIDDTIEVLEKILKTKYNNFIYQASW